MTPKDNGCRLWGRRVERTARGSSNQQFSARVRSQGGKHPRRNPAGLEAAAAASPATGTPAGPLSRRHRKKRLVRPVSPGQQKGRRGRARRRGRLSGRAASGRGLNSCFPAPSGKLPRLQFPADFGCRSRAGRIAYRTGSPRRHRKQRLAARCLRGGRCLPSRSCLSIGSGG